MPDKVEEEHWLYSCDMGWTSGVWGSHQIYFSVCKSVPDKKWLYSCGIFMFYARQSGGGALKFYGMNIWCVWGSHLVYLVVACLCQIRNGVLPTNSIHVLLHRHLSVVALCFLIKLGGILRRMMVVMEPHNRQQMDHKRWYELPSRQLSVLALCFLMEL